MMPIPQAATGHPDADLPDAVRQMTPVTSFGLIREILGSRDFALAGRDHTRPFLLRTIGLTEGAEHLARRRLEASLFRPALLGARHARTVDDAIDSLMRPLFGSGETATADLVQLVFAIESLIMARFVGIELPGDELSAVEDLVPRMRHVNDGQSLVWSRNDPVEDAWRVRRELVAFTERYLMPAIDRAIRDRGTRNPETVIETLAAAYDPTTWDGELICREAWTYMAAGVQTSTYTILDALALLLDWLGSHPQDKPRVLDPSSDFLSRVVSESLRLNVPNPAIFRIALRPGVTTGGFPYQEGQEFALYTGIADRDTAVFGPDADQFNPDRQVPEGVPRWGFAFGHGHHACIGRTLALGRPAPRAESLFEGSTVSILRAFVSCGAAYVAGDAPTYRGDTFKAAFQRFPVCLRKASAGGE
jgi:cytochrome P450